MRLFICEFQRLIKRKSIWLAFLAVPLICYGLCIKLADVYSKEGIPSEAMLSLHNFPVISLQQSIVFLFNIIIIFIIALSVTSEYSSGEIRMVLIRPIKKENVFICKFLSVVVLVGLYLVFYLICSYVIGYFKLESIDKVMILDASNLLQSHDAVIFTLKYYLTSFVSLLPMISIAYLIATLSKSVIVTLCTGVGFTVVSMGYSTFIQIFARAYESNMDKIKLLSITEIEQNGVGKLLLGSNEIIVFISSVILIYFIVSITLSFIVNRRKDQYV